MSGLFRLNTIVKEGGFDLICVGLKSLVVWDNSQALPCQPYPVLKAVILLLCANEIIFIIFCMFNTVLPSRSCEGQWP